jgi:hypothetical protein
LPTRSTIRYSLTLDWTPYRQLVQQILQQVDYRLALLDAAQREEKRLKRVQDEDRRRELTEAAIEALKAVSRQP